MNDTTAEKVHLLLKKRYSELQNLQLDREIFLLGISVLAKCDGCIWCRQGRISGELLRLLSFPENECKSWFMQTTTKALSSCAECLELYYTIRHELKSAFTRLYEPFTLKIFWEKVTNFDRQRINEPLQSFIDGKIDSKSQSLLFSLYELLLFPDHLRDRHLRENFKKVLSNLVAARKMIRVNRLLPGIFLCLFDDEQVIKNWSLSALESSQLEKVDSFIPGALDYKNLFENCKVGNELAKLQGILKVVEWIPRKTTDEDLSIVLSYIEGAIGSFPDISFLAVSALVSSCYPKTLSAWTNSFDTIFHPHILESTLSKNNLSTEKFTWMNSVIQWTINSEDGALYKLLTDRLTPIIAATNNNVLLLNLLRTIASLFANGVIKILSPKCYTECYRLLSISIERIAEFKPLMEDLAQEYTIICLEFDFYCMKNDRSCDFRGFGKLLTGLLEMPRITDLIIETTFSFYSTRLASIFDLLEGRPLFVHGLIKSSKGNLIAKSDIYFAVYLILSHVAQDFTNLQLLLRSYPEKITNSLKHLIDLSMDKWPIPRYFQMLNIFKNSFGKVLFMSDETNILQLFPESTSLYQNVVFCSFYLAIKCLSQRPSPDKSISLDDCNAIFETFWVGAKIYIKYLHTQSRKDSLENIKLSAEGYSIFVQNIFRYMGSQKSIDLERLVIVYNCIVNAAMYLKFTLSNDAQRMMGIFLTCYEFDGDNLQSILGTIDEYEKRLNCLLPRPIAKPKANVQVDQKRYKERLYVDIEIEERILEDLQSETQRRLERRLPVSLRSGSIPIVARSASKVDQIRAELSASTSVVPKKRNPNINLTRVSKPIKLDLHTSSASDDSNDEQDFSRVKNKFNGPITTNQPNLPSRSVKLIDVMDLTDNKQSGSNQRSDAPSGASELDLIKKFHRTILHFDLENIEHYSDDQKTIDVVPNEFGSSEHYIKIFEPLLFAECRAQLAQSFEETFNDDIQVVRISGVSHMDDFHEVVLVSGFDDDRIRLSDEDYLILLFREEKERLPAVVVHTCSKNGQLETTLRMSIPDHKASLQLELREGLKMNFRKVGNVITNLREFTALHAISAIGLGVSILRPKLKVFNNINVNADLEKIRVALNINDSQAKAIAAVVQGVNPITLIQGPPGTGKTKTIEALIGVLLSKNAGASSRNGRLLICAPSNAAIDEIVRRIRMGLYSDSGQKYLAKIVRVGSIEMISDAAKDLTLDSQVEKLAQSKGAFSPSTTLLEAQRKKCDDLRRKLQVAESSKNEDQIKSLKSSLWEAKELMRKNVKFIEDTKATLRTRILNEAQIICCTLSSSGHDTLSRLNFDYVIIDEACQAVELSCLIPLQRNCRQCILVGDPNQLPPTVISQMAGVFSYEQSLFVRLQKVCPESVLLLDTQYRMHPEISRFPNNYFYEGRLKDGPGTDVLNFRSWHRNKILGAFRFFDVSGREDRWRRDSGVESRSKMNELEAITACHLVTMICLESPNYQMSGKIGIVTPYKDQRRALRREMSKRFGQEILSHIEISTVDGFQGQEREVIIFSCVRTGENRGIGFLNDTRRLNVALTRAKCSLFVLGKASTLIRNPIWKAMIEEAKDRDCFVQYDSRMWEKVENIRRLDNICLDPLTTKKPSSIDGKDPLESIKAPKAIQTAAQRQITQQQGTLVPPPRPSTKLVIDEILDRNKNSPK